MWADLARPGGLVALAAPLAAGILWWRWPPRLDRGPRLAALCVRAAVLSAIALALAGLQLNSTPSAQTLVVAVDRSASLLGALGGEAATVQDVGKAKSGKDQLGVVTFGHDAAVDTPPSRQPEFSGFTTEPGADFTDIESGLRLAGSVIPTGTRRHVLLVSDGRQNVGDAVRQAGVLRAEGVRVDVLPVDVASGPDARVDSVVVPADVTQKSTPQARVEIVSNIDTSARLRLEVDGTVVADKPERLTLGDTSITATLPAAGPGLHTVRALIDPVADTVTENNVGEALYQVLGAQRVLVIQGQPGEGANVAAALRAASLNPTVVSPAFAPRSAAGFGAFQAVALVDVGASQLGADRMTALATATKALAVGLATFGGPATYGPGGWAGTPLEAALPVEMRIPDRAAKPPVAVVLVLESVESSAGDSVVRGAARSLVANLAPTDLVGVTDALNGFAVPLQPLTARSKVEAAISNIAAFGDPESYVSYLTDAAQALAAHPEATKHIIILGDGDTPELPSAAYMASLVRQGITVSAVGVDVHGSTQFMANMQAIVTEGNGRYYQSESPAQVPDVLLDETRTSLQPWIVQQRFRPSLGAPSEALAGIDPSSLPALDGYVASTPKPAAQVILGGPGGDPILAQWTYGAGRAAAWTSDASGQWTAALLAWPDAGRLLAEIVASTLPLTSDPSVQVNMTFTGDQLHVLVQMPTSPTGASVTATIVAPDGTATQAALLGTGPGRYEADLPAGQVGPYLLHVAVYADGKVMAQSTAGAAAAYSPEYRFIGTDQAALSQIARAGGGQVLTRPAGAFSVVVPAVRVEHTLVAWLLGFAVVGFLIDVAIRRLSPRRGDAAVWGQAWARMLRRVPIGHRSADQASEPAPVLARLRQRLEQSRTTASSRRDSPNPAAEEPSMGADPTVPNPGRATASHTAASPSPAEQPAHEPELAARLLERRRARSRGDGPRRSPD